MTAPAPSSPEGLDRGSLLRRRVDFQRCYQQGGKRHGALLSLHVHPSPESRPRLGITASRKVGSSVVRHRLKRRIREIYRRWPRRGELPPLDVVVHLKPAASRADFAALRAELEGLLGGLIRRGAAGAGA